MINNNITPLSPDEQETAINWFSTDTNAIYNTADPKMIKLLDKYVAAYPDEFRCTYEDELYRNKIYTFPRKYLKITKPHSQAQIEAAKRTIEKVNNKN